MKIFMLVFLLEIICFYTDFNLIYECLSVCTDEAHPADWRRRREQVLFIFPQQMIFVLPQIAGST